MGEKVFWTGPCADGKADSEGVAVTKIGDEVYSRYEGDYVNGKRQGYGVLVFTGGVRYQGNFKDDLFDGTGVWSTIKGDRYDGEFVAGKFHGKGIWVTAQGDRYEGDFREDKIEGQGQCPDTTESSTRAPGVTANRPATAFGPRRMAAATEGEFADDRFNGWGMLTWGAGTELSGSRYEGEFQDDKFHGKGVFTGTTGIVYEGAFVEGKRQWPGHPHMA